MVLYYAKIWDNEGNLLKDFIPAISQEEGHENEACLFDNVTQAYFYNIGTESFAYINDNSCFLESVSGATEKKFTYTGLAGYQVKCNVSGFDNLYGDAEVSTVFGVNINKLDLSLEGDPIVGSTLSVTSPTVNLNECNYEWSKGNNNKYYAHTPNILDDGTQNGNYSNNYSNTQVVTIPGVTKINVSIRYQTESVGCDWVCIFAGNHPNYDGYTSGYLHKLGGTGNMTFTVESDSVTFAFRTDGSVVNYGYYAVVTSADPFEILSNEKTYTIKEEDAGFSINCSISGTDNNYGSQTLSTTNIEALIPEEEVTE
jgi:hypothetical protein